uniref:Uncharacterized protein n=1 Tax=Anguilla anguilla TaxID=7936 RepID=A0A0E9X375_ANGAN
MGRGLFNNTCSLDFYLKSQPCKCKPVLFLIVLSPVSFLIPSPWSLTVALLSCVSFIQSINVCIVFSSLIIIQFF